MRRSPHHFLRHGIPSGEGSDATAVDSGLPSSRSGPLSLPLLGCSNSSVHTEAPPSRRSRWSTTSSWHLSDHGSHSFVHAAGIDSNWAGGRDARVSIAGFHMANAHKSAWAPSPRISARDAIRRRVPDAAQHGVAADGLVTRLRLALAPAAERRYVGRTLTDSCEMR
jgi:hypothetical protein